MVFTPSAACGPRLGSHWFEDKLLGEGVLGFRHLLVSPVNAIAHLPVDTCQHTEDIIHV